MLTGSECAIAAGAGADVRADTYAEMFAENDFATLSRRFEPSRKPVIAALAG